MVEGLIGLLVVLLVFAVILYVIEAAAPPFKLAIRVVMALILIVYLLRFARLV